MLPLLLMPDRKRRTGDITTDVLMPVCPHLRPFPPPLPPIHRLCESLGVRSRVVRGWEREMSARFAGHKRILASVPGTRRRRQKGNGTCVQSHMESMLSSGKSHSRDNKRLVVHQSVFSSFSSVPGITSPVLVMGSSRVDEDCRSFLSLPLPTTRPPIVTRGLH